MPSGRTTVEEASVNDSGRVQEFIQGRHLITPDELISLNKEVIIFTADTRPLKLPLTEPTAYEQPASYNPPVRDKHEVSEFVRKRGRAARNQEQEQGRAARPVAPSKTDDDKPQQKQKSVNRLPEAVGAETPINDVKTQSKLYPKSAPDYDL